MQALKATADKMPGSAGKTESPVLNLEIVRGPLFAVRNIAIIVIYDTRHDRIDFRPRHQAGDICRLGCGIFQDARGGVAGS